ncbi:tyrosine-type recombinase/integrase, partial [Streptomyces albidoflavus]
WNTLPQTATRRQIYIVMNMVMSRAVKLGEIKENPCKVEGVSRIKSPKKEVQHWADLRFLVQMANDVQMEALLWTLAGTGMRVGEALAIDWQDIDFDGGTIQVGKHLTRFGLEDGYKAHNEKERTVVAFPEALEALQTLQLERGGVQSGPVFLHSRGGRLTYTPAWDRFDALRKSIGLDIGFHHIRALHASTFVKHATIEQTMAQLGHDDLRSTLRYVASDAESRKAVVKAIHGTY